MFTRFTIAKIIPDKTPDSVLKVLVNDWIKFWGSPSQILVDNGGEFVNAKMMAICETFSITFLTTGAYSPNQNGLCEKNHQLVDKMIAKMMDDDKSLKFPEGLSSAVIAKNTLINVYGFSPLQLVTGRQSRLPGASRDNLAGLREEHEETRGISRISSLQKARKAFMEVENLARLKKALAARPTKKELYRLGEKVFFKYGTDNKWHGPGRIVAIDNKGIYIKHGRVVIHTSEPRVTKTALGTRFDDKR